MDGGGLFLGIELGSTRIKAVLIDKQYNTLASGGFEWENRFENGVWTYRTEDVWTGLRACFGDLSGEYQRLYGAPPADISGIGVSAMMHGYMAFDERDNLLTPFRTWRNTSTGQAADLLTDAFSFNIPQRWSVAHLEQAILNGEAHVADVAFLTTLSGYVHWKLTGEKVLGVGDASGMFPIDGGTNDFDVKMLRIFDDLASGMPLKRPLRDILPKVLTAGASAGVLTEEGARLLDASGRLKAGIPLCPPEGDAGTGMTATNSVAERTGNVSAGTSIFAMIVLEKELSRVYPEIDIVTTPTGKPVAMVHCNNCTTDLDAWVRLFQEANELMGLPADKSELYQKLYNLALEGDADCGGLLAYNYYSGEHTTGFTEGRPLFVRTPDSRFTLANVMRTLLYSAISTLKLGMNLLTEKENVRLDVLLGHGGLFKSGSAGQRFMAAALGVPVAVMKSASEGGAQGIALLAAYMIQKEKGESLEDFLARKVFAESEGVSIEPDAKDAKGYASFIERYAKGFEIERAAVKYLK